MFSLLDKIKRFSGYFLLMIGIGGVGVAVYEAAKDGKIEQHEVDHIVSKVKDLKQ